MSAPAVSAITISPNHNSSKVDQSQSQIYKDDLSGDWNLQIGTDQNSPVFSAIHPTNESCTSRLPEAADAFSITRNYHQVFYPYSYFPRNYMGDFGGSNLYSNNQRYHQVVVSSVIPPIFTDPFVNLTSTTPPTSESPTSSFSSTELKNNTSSSNSRLQVISPQFSLISSLANSSIIQPIITNQDDFTDSAVPQYETSASIRQPLADQEYTQNNHQFPSSFGHVSLSRKGPYPPQIRTRPIRNAAVASNTKRYVDRDSTSSESSSPSPPDFPKSKKARHSYLPITTTTAVTAITPDETGAAKIDEGGPIRTTTATTLGESVYNKWTPEEDRILHSAIARVTKNNASEVAGKWVRVAQLVPNRTPIQCSARWSGALNRNIVRGKWTSDEDKLLLEAVGQEMGRIGNGSVVADTSDLNWQGISKAVPGRTGVQCAARYQEALCPGIRKGKWSEEEDVLLKQGLMQYGKSWVKIAASVPNRTQRQCRTRWLQIYPKMSTDEKEEMEQLCGTPIAVNKKS
ncbi:hypothetical protein HK100_008994 [Physocladia obscura]|uniref:Uncharacterized protein n=1 Tax=Physocladia obscura TaxID=109957 RepID=A0AAD5TBV5_9FUNG|nr:hypothetical protein HK100_008994 [Physocladia obscura]